MCLGEMVIGVRCEGVREVEWKAEGGDHLLKEVDYRNCRDEWLLDEDSNR
jgi:hypothetical protein